MSENLDKISAVVGFSVCDVIRKIYKVTKEKITNCINLDGFEKLNIDSKEIAGDVKITDKTLIDIFLGVINPLADAQKKISEKQDKTDKEKTFKEIKDYWQRNEGPDFKEFEREINKALGILIEDGLFAYAIWLKSEDKIPHKALSVATLYLLKHDKINLLPNDVHVPGKTHLELINGIVELSETLEKTLLARQILERMLIYAIYRAKAYQKGE